MNKKPFIEPTLVEEVSLADGTLLPPGSPPPV